MGGLRWASVVLVTVAVSSAGCGGGTASRVSPRLRAALPEISTVSDVTAASDAETNALLDDAGLRKRFGVSADAVYALLERGRHDAIDEQRRPNFTNIGHKTSFTTAPAPSAVLLAASGAEVFVVEFAQYFETLLDPATAGQMGSGGDIPSRTSPAISTDDGTRTVSTTVAESYNIAIAGSRVTFTLLGQVEQKVTDDKSHATVADLTDTRTYRGEINVCPDSGGGVPASMTSHIRIKNAPSSSSVDASLTLLGHVNDQAALGATDSSYDNITSWDTGGVTLHIGNISTSGDAKASSLDVTKATGSVDTAGNATSSNVSSAASDAGVSIGLMGPVVQEAQRLWRHGRCVVVAVPPYSAETPLAISQQDSVQHTEEVDKGSDTTVGVVLKHRFGAPPNAPVDLTLSGDKKIDPDHLDAAPGQVTYTAPDEDDKSATLTLTSTSKRGIGKLVIQFDTKSKKLAMSMNGSMTFGSGSITMTAQFRASVAPFTPVGDGTYRASLPATTTYNLTFPGENCTSANGSEGRGVLVFTGTIDEGPDKKPVWHVKLDGKRSVVRTNETACGISFSNLPLSGTAGGLVGGMASLAGVITFPADGGTVRVNKSLSGLSMNATFVATVPK